MTEAVEVKPLNIWQRINEVRKLCHYVQKDKKVEGLGYMAVTHDAVTSGVRMHLIEQGIIIVPRLISSAVVDTTTTTAKNVPIIRYEARYEIDFVNCDEPSDRVTVPIEAHALDQGDKAPGKAASYATKYAMLKLFSIETGEGEEERMDAKAKHKKDVAQAVIEAGVTPAGGVLATMTPEQLKRVNKLASDVTDCLALNDVDAACTLIDHANLDVEELVGVWTFFDSKERAAIKKQDAVRRKAMETAPA